MRLGPARSTDADDRLRRARHTVWSAAQLDGPVADRRSNFRSQVPADLDLLGLDEPSSLYGLATLPAGKQPCALRPPCGKCPTRDLTGSTYACPPARLDKVSAGHRATDRRIGRALGLRSGSHHDGC